MIRLVVGLAFHGFPPVVLLQRKNHPDWQNHLLNGPGGMVRDDEMPIDAMVREFLEETGIVTTRADWSSLCIETARHAPEIREPGWVPYQVFYYRTEFTEDNTPQPTKLNDKDEPQNWMSVRQVLSDRFIAGGMVGNLQWLIPLALDWRRMNTSVLIWDDIRRKPRW